MSWDPSDDEPLARRNIPRGHCACDDCNSTDPDQEEP